MILCPQSNNCGTIIDLTEFTHPVLINTFLVKYLIEEHTSTFPPQFHITYGQMMQHFTKSTKSLHKYR